MDHKQNTIIESIGVYLPPQSFSTDEIMKGCKHKINFPLEKITGIRTRRMAGQEEFSIHLARNAVADCLEKSKYQSSDIDLLICCNISRYNEQSSISFEPSTSIQLKKEFAFTDAIAFDISNACAGMFTGIYIVNAFIKSGAIRRGMVVSGEYITHLTRAAQRDIEGFMDNRLACLTLGDAGAALILEKASENNTGFTEIELQTFGAYSQYCIARASEHGDMMMYTDSINLTDVAVKSGAKHAINLLQRAGWSSESFQHLIMHQTSTMTMNSARRAINQLLESEVCNDGNTINNLEQRGNTASTSHFVALADQIRTNKIHSGDKIAFSISASGLTTGTALYVFDDLPDRFRQMESGALIPEKKSFVKGPGLVSPRNASKVRIESLGTIDPSIVEKRNSLEYLKAAATNCLYKSSFTCNEIGMLIFSGVYRSDYLLEPAYATLLAGELGMNATISVPDGGQTLAFDIFNSSLGFLNACYVAQQMIAVNNCENIMVVAAEAENNVGTFSAARTGIRETASAIILEKDVSNEKGFSRFLFSYDLDSINAYTSYYSTKNSSSCLHIEKDKNLEALYIAAIVPAVENLLQMEGLYLEDIDLVFPPQISSHFISNLGESLHISRSKFVDVVGNGLDFFSSSLAFGIKHEYDQKLIQTGHMGLMISVGSGIQIGCAIYHF